MKFIIKLAIKNLFRHGKRTFITAMAIAYGLAILIWMDSTLKWADNESQRNLKIYEYGNYVVSTEEFNEERKTYPLDSMLDKKTINTITKVAEKNGCKASPRTGFSSTISFNRGFGLPFIVMAIDPVKDSEVFEVKKDIKEGSYLNPDSRGILISAKCSRELGAGLNDYINIETATKNGTQQFLSLKVTGIFETPDPVVNKIMLFITRELADSDLQAEGTASEVAIALKNGNEASVLENIKSDLKKAGLGALIVNTWDELGKDYFAMSRTKKGGSSIMMFFIVVIVAVGIINTMLMAVFERVRELGMMRALGLKDNMVIWSFIIESAGIGFIGSIIGVIMGIGLNYWVIRWGWDFSSLMKDMDIGYRTGTVFYGQWNPEMMVKAVIFGILCSILVSIIPARKAVKLEITDSIRYI